MARVFLSLGSNQGDRLELLRRAIELLTRLPGVRFLDASRLYETEPWDALPGEIVDRARWFLNCVLAIETSLSPAGLLTEIQAIERTLGRVRTGASVHPRDPRLRAPRPPAWVPAPRGYPARAEPRTMDIDILLYGDEVISAEDNLHIPHLFLHERGFVLRPLADLAPDLEHPVLYRTIGDLLEELEDDHQVLASELPRQWFVR